MTDYLTEAQAAIYQAEMLARGGGVLDAQNTQYLHSIALSLAGILDILLDFADENGNIYVANGGIDEHTRRGPANSQVGGNGET